jgi:glutaredoxin
MLGQVSRLLAVALLAWTGLAGAQQYRWTDENGRRQYGDIPPSTAKDVKMIGASAAGAKPQALPPVTLYTNSNCGALCTEARVYLQKRSVPFTEVSVEEPADVEKLRELTGGTQNVPVLTIGAAVHRGYHPTFYEKVLATAGYPAKP